ncbi:hypothetical protein C7T35_32850 [Variovorax sp. WS11]|nr:hypothetical protein C7T35_32850 [Variovorax sp. WS11]
MGLAPLGPEARALAVRAHAPGTGGRPRDRHRPCGAAQLHPAQPSARQPVRHHAHAGGPLPVHLARRAGALASMRSTRCASSLSRTVRTRWSTGPSTQWKRATSR